MNMIVAVKETQERIREEGVGDDSKEENKNLVLRVRKVDGKELVKGDGIGVGKRRGHCCGGGSGRN